MLASPRTPSRRRGGALGAAFAAIALASCAASAPSDPPTHHAAARPAATVPACAGATQATVATADATVAEHIYANELAGREIKFDLANVSGADDLRSAVAAGDQAATVRAAARIVFHPAWHIVRLQVFDAAGKLLADFGGAYVIAPVRGVLQAHGRRIGSFLMSVQDDTGETKLETRFVGNPVAIYAGGFLIATRFGTFPPAPPPGPTLVVSGRAYLVVSQTFAAFPSGPLTEVMLVPPPSSALARLPCAAVRAAEFGRVAQRLAALATDLPHQYPGYATTVAVYSGVDVFVRSGRLLLGTSGGAGPRNPPQSGTVAYQGKTWLVFSFTPLAGVRVYLLIPPA